MATRESIDSTHSTSPLITGPSFHQPPPPHNNYPNIHDKAPGNDTATKLKIATVIAAFRLLAVIAGLAIGVSFALLGAWRVVTILLIVITWISAAWNAILVVSFIRRPSLRVSLVRSDGKIINFGAQNQGDGKGKRRRCIPRAFWFDSLLAASLFAFNIAEGVTGNRYHRSTVALNWFTVSFNIIIALLTMSPAVVTGHIRFESVEMPQISLP